MRAILPGVLPILLLLFLAAAIPGFAQSKNEAETHPRVYLTPADVKRAEENIRRFAWARAERDAILREAAPWLAKPDTWYDSILPKRGAAFGFGTAGCPVCGAKTGMWWEVKASFDRPGEITCASGHTLPDAVHPDSGTGFVGKDGRTHYFVGSYNAWVIEKLTFGAANHLAYAYTLTGDARYAAKAAHILDLIASIYPSCDKGSWDWPSNPPSGRLDRPLYQVARVLVHFTDQYDQICPSGTSLDAPSVVPGLTRRQNIEENLLKNGAKYCYDKSRGYKFLNNGNADYTRGAMAVGICLDIPEYVTYAVDNPYGIRSLLDNNIDRDGKYYETSPLYADHSRDLYLSFAEPLWNYRGSAYPRGVDLYQNPRLRSFLLLHNLSQDCNGRKAPYGDTRNITSPVAIPSRSFDARDMRALERLYARTPDPQGRREIGALLQEMTGGKLDAERLKASSLTEVVGGGTADRTWLLFHADAVSPTDTKGAAARLEALKRSALFGQKGVGILRAGEGENSQALLLRYGPSLNHGHLDDLNINFFARGYELTYDLGYGPLGSAHSQAGWAMQTASHNLVVVDEKSQNGVTTGGSLHLFADMPGLQLIEASAEGGYAGEDVRLYRRTIALIDGYLLDIFRVRGGQQHDYFFHGMGGQTQTKGVSLGAEEAGSLAGTDIDWSEKLQNDGDIAGYRGKLNWNPPPGNGYGFLAHVRRSTAGSGAIFQSEWQADPSASLRLMMPLEPGTEMITAVGPSVDPTLPKADYIVARRRGADLSSQYIGIMEPFSSAAPATVESVERLDIQGQTGSVPPVAARLRRHGKEDFIYSSGDSVVRKAGGHTVAARFVCARKEAGSLTSLALVGAERFEGDGWRVTTRQGVWNGSVTGADYGRNVLTVNADLPTDGRLDGKIVTFSSDRYSRNTAYRIRRIVREEGKTRLYVEGTLDLGRGLVDTVGDEHTLTTPILHPYALPLRRTGDSGFLRGKRIRSEQGATTTITGVQLGAPMSLRVASTAAFRPGNIFRYYDVAEGDRFEIVSTASLTRLGPNRYRLVSDVEVEVTPPSATIHIER